MNPRHVHHRRHGWLWWLAVLILLVGVGISYAVRIQPVPNPTLIRRIWVITVILAGTCVVSATADKWLRR